MTPAPCHTSSAPQHSQYPLPPFLLALFSQSGVRKAEHLEPLQESNCDKGPVLATCQTALDL